MTPLWINANENEICGEWIINEGKVCADDKCNRIETLIAGYFQELGSDDSGWDRLYLDTNDGRYWELTYPNSEQHGGGPPCLKCISEDEAHIKYHLGGKPDLPPGN